MNDEFLIDGKKYISSKRCSHIWGYTNDYIARLCREGKVSGDLVSRTWYVEEDSLKKYLDEASQKKSLRRSLQSEIATKLYRNGSLERGDSTLHSLSRISSLHEISKETRDRTFSKFLTSQEDGPLFPELKPIQDQVGGEIFQPPYIPNNFDDEREPLSSDEEDRFADTSFSVRLPNQKVISNTHFSLFSKIAVPTSILLFFLTGWFFKDVIFMTFSPNQTFVRSTHGLENNNLTKASNHEVGFPEMVNKVFDDAISLLATVLSVGNGSKKVNMSEDEKIRINVEEIERLKRSLLSEYEVSTTTLSISIHGANPTIINVGSKYVDLGADIFNDNGQMVRMVTLGYEIDTTTAGSHIVTYVATDTSGNTATSTRMVIVVKQGQKTSDNSTDTKKSTTIKK